MATTAFLDLIEELRALGGAPKVTYPTADVAFPQTERLVKARRGSHILAFLTAEPDATRFPSCVLTDQIEQRSDAQMVEVYRKYEVIPGKWVTSTHLDDDSLIVTTARRRNYVADITSGEGVSDITGIWTRTTMENSNSLVADEVVATRVIPGTTKVEYEQDPEYLLDIETATTKVNAADVTAPGVVVGQTTAFKSIDADVSDKIVESVPTAALDAFYLAFPGGTSLRLPRVLLSLTAVWDVTTATGAFAESGSGAATGASASLQIAAQGRGQGSASVNADLIPVFSEPWTDDLPVIDYFFFIPKNSTAAQILTKLTTIINAIAGNPMTPIVVNSWPVWKPVTHTIILTGQKVSLSAEATARCAVSLNAADVSETTSTGAGVNKDYGSTVKSVTIPECLHGSISIAGGATNSSTANASASAVVASGTNFPGASSTPAASTAVAAGAITPSTLSATSPVGLPASGLYALRPDVANYKWSYSTVRVRVFDFATLA